MPTIGERLKQLRTAKGLSQYEVARLFKMSRSTYANYETGIRDPDFDTLCRLADFFGVSTDYLLGRTDDPKGSLQAGNNQSSTCDDEVYVVFRGKRQELPPEYKRVLIDMMEAAYRKMADKRPKKS